MSEIGIGTQLGVYRVLALIGQGGMGTVYRAERVDNGERVALKVLAESLASSPDFRRRFTREARYARELDHPNVVRVNEVGEADRHLYMAMPEIRGTDLKTLLALEGRLSPARTVSILTEVGGALDALHGRGIIHRDVKPGNVIIASGESDEPAGRAYLTDFGLGKDPSRDSGALTAVGEFVGTFHYVAPEQVLGKEFDHRVDIYSFGCLLYECLTGLPPFPHEQEVRVLDAHVEDPPPPVSAARPDVPADLDAVVAKAMAKDPAARHASATEAMAAAAATLGVAWEPPAAPGGPPPSLRLAVTAGPGAGAELAVGQELVIGREAGEEGNLAGDSELSRRHARIWRDESSYMIEDLGSTNGTLVGGQAIEAPVSLGRGDVIVVGGTTLVVSLPSERKVPLSPLALRLEIDFDRGSAAVAVSREGEAVQLVARGGSWTAEPS